MTSHAFDWLQESPDSAISSAVGKKPEMLPTAREKKVQPALVGQRDCNWLKKLCLQFLTKEYEVWPQGYSTYITEGRKKKERIKEVGLCVIFYLNCFSQFLSELLVWVC